MGKKFKNKDLAARLGVSGTLVSLVLNNKADQHGIRKDTQERVLALARQMGYFALLPEKEEKYPVEETPGIIGMIVSSQNDSFVTGISPYLQKAFSSIGVGFSVITRDTDDLRFDRMIGAFKKFFSGIILVGNAADDSTIRTLRSTDYPFVVLERNQRTVRYNTVSTDTTAGANMVVSHIRKLGYKNVVIMGDRVSQREDNSLIGEIENLLNQADTSYKPVTIHLEHNNSDGYDFSPLDSYIKPPYRADVILVTHSSLVYPVMAMLRKRKLRVPQDMAVISMEEGEGFDLMFAPVTCLRKPFPGMATKVANMLWSEIKNSGKAKFKRQVNISPELVVRDSCGTFNPSISSN